MIRDFLCLFHRQPGLPAGGIPGVVDFHFREAAVIQPLIEELVEAEAADFFHDIMKIIRADDAIAVPLQIGADGFAVQVRAELAAQHVKDPCTLWINPRVKLLHGILVITPDGRALVIG